MTVKTKAVTGTAASNDGHPAGRDVAAAGTLFPK